MIRELLADKFLYLAFKLYKKDSDKLAVHKTIQIIFVGVDDE